MVDSTAYLFADPDAEPPRLTRNGIVRRIASGQPLPPPVAGMDLVIGGLLPGTVADHFQVLENFYYGVREDASAVAALNGARPKGIGWEVRDSFAEVGPEDGDVFEEDDEPGGAPRCGC